MSSNIKHSNGLKWYRLKRHLTQRDVLKALGHKSASRLSAWENGSALPSSTHLKILSTLYRVPVEKLLGIGTRKQKRVAYVSMPETTKTFPISEPAEEELIDKLAQILVEAYLYEKRAMRTSNQEVDFLQTGSS